MIGKLMTDTRVILGALAIVAVSATFGYSIVSNGNAQSSGASSSEAEIEQIIRRYILENPGIIAEALDKHAAQEMLLEEAKQQENLARHLPALLDAEAGYVMGARNDQAKVAVIELFDYHCGYCKSAAQYVSDLVQTENDVKVVLRELPILREESKYAAEIALAARDQGKYSDLHFAMMRASGILDEDRIDEIARNNGIDTRSLYLSHQDTSYEEILDQTLEIAIDIGLTGTPSFIVASMDGSYQRIIPYWDPEELSLAIEEARNAS